jgi:predicted amidohydrolase
MLDRAVIGLVQWLPTPAGGQENLAYAERQITNLAGCDLIVLPELWPNACDGVTAAADAAAVAEPIDGPRTAALADAARRAGSWLVAGSMPERVGTKIYNSAAVFDRAGKLRGVHRKAHLYTPLGEHRVYAAGDHLLVVDTDEFGPLGVVTCFDGDFPEVARALADAGVRVVAHPAAYEQAAETWWDRLYPANALLNGQWWISVNQCGANGGVTQLGASRILSPLGDTITEAVRARDGETPPPVTLRVEIELAALLAAWQPHCAVLRDGIRHGLSIDRPGTPLP